MTGAIALALALGASTLAACCSQLPASPPAPRAPASVTAPAAIPEIAARVTAVDRYPARHVSFPNGVRGIPDIAYWSPIGYRPLTLDLYLPPSSGERPASGYPLVIYVHGGGGRAGDPHRNGAFVDFPGVLASLSERGYVVASIEYRLSSEAHFPARAQDVKAATRWLRVSASKFGIHPQRILTWGISAGAHLAALAAVSCGVEALEPIEPSEPVPGGSPDPRFAAASDCVQGAVAWSGVFHLTTLAEQASQGHALSREDPRAPEWQWLGCFARDCPPAHLDLASPVHHVDGKDPPLLLIAGAEDRTVPHAQTLEMAAKLAAAGVRHELLLLPGVDHSFIGRTPEQT